jgi:hypothetical protein
MGGMNRAKAVRWRRLFVLVATVSALAACGTTLAPPLATGSLGSPTGGTASAPPASAAPSPTPAAVAIVGEWVGQHDCATIETLLETAGLEEFLLEAVVGNELIPGVTDERQLEDPDDPCKGAVVREHSHFFTADGRFGSRDFNGRQVDDGFYQLENEDIVIINDQTFHYRIDGDSISFTPDPVDISACTTKLCRFMASWVLMVAMPGTTFTKR